MKTLYLHIGLHKTGSTSLQSALFENLDILKARGYLLPEAGRNPRAEEKIIHSNISHDIRQARAFAPGAGGLAEVLHEIRTAAPRVPSSATRACRACPTRGSRPTRGS